ncbi:hypothetical protein WN55_01753 [Dufourea novaeangliae]|uniref:Uncharacterized protein n=1 Tax=Dufourea novaeangliae TaxID=178035 RepID=A0A154NW90_DUFNO|nr:hypothetical protein WN55_01753 [Dufourea novaeangliae]
MFEPPTTKENMKQRIRDVCASVTLEMLTNVRTTFIFHMLSFLYFTCCPGLTREGSEPKNSDFNKTSHECFCVFRYFLNITL